MKNQSVLIEFAFMVIEVAKDNFRDSRMSEIAELKKIGSFRTVSIDQS